MPIKDAPNLYAENLRDMILDNSAITEDLLDDPANEVINWGITQADRVGLMVQDDEDYEDKSSALVRLLRTMSKLAGRRADKDHDWMSSQLDRLNRYSQKIDGPILSEAQQAQLLNTQIDKDNMALIQELIRFYTPRSATPDPSVGPPAPSLEQPEETASYTDFTLPHSDDDANQ